MADPAWEDFDVEEEEVTEEEAKDIESGGVKVPIGLYLCKVVASKPKQIDFKAYSTLGVNLCYEIHRVLEIGGMPPDDQASEFYKWKKIFDDVAFQNKMEKDAMAKRRKYVALKIGIIKPGQTLKKSMWQYDVLGKFVIIRVVANNYTNKNGDEVEGTKVGFFDGYESADAVEAVVEKAEEWDDI